MSSHWEGFGLAAVEGMASGKPVIASDIDGLREVVSDAGVLFPHEDYQQLATEITKLTTDTDYYQIVATRCHTRALNFDISKMVEGYDKAYKTI
jgi:glycosyltransferase involved in cell wall biosynthesis